MTRVPGKLSKDAILEVNFEIRFQPLSDAISESILSKLSERYIKEGYRLERLPVGEIPPAIRERDAALQVQPVFRLRGEGTSFSVAVGSRIYSFAVSGKYCGWATLVEELRKFIENFFASEVHASISRLGLRYQNALTTPDHYIDSIFDLKIGLTIAGEVISSPVSITYTTDHSEAIRSNCRIVSSEYAQGDLPDETKALVDIDMFTANEVGVSSEKDVMKWVVRAHDKEKLQFFSILPNNVIDKLEV